ncbi:FeoB-associated Cys-rich membrane protein [Winogradskyella psychrotolerans]|nr:FeoB-associated Cys-rich membrane protein [Winogradskyella psychrotolerans]MBU2926892.1 FeoB-associated Cys-rich membrane protein [Winogradskyella psychrotolerans]
MNTIIQNILVFTSVGLAVFFLAKKYFLPAKKKSTKACGGDDGCGCH